jgi:hypothetical protein
MDTRVVLASGVSHDALYTFDEGAGGGGIAVEEVCFGGEAVGVRADSLGAVPAWEALEDEGKGGVF